jgi:O-methyltransferase involved in polyketide biosynthesis
MLDGERLGVVGETLLTPLYAKAKASEIVPEAGFEDPLAARLLARVGYDLDRVLTDHGNVAGAIRRTQAIDEVTAAFAAAHPDAQVVSVGIGLCTRHDRLAGRVPAGARWIGVDTADVVDLRRELLPDDPVELHAASIADPAWAGGIDPERPTLVIAEGVLMYLDAGGLASFLAGGRDRFGPGTEVVGDHFHPKVASSDRHPIVRATGARFLSGVRNGRELADLVDGYELVAELPVMELLGSAQRTAARAFRLASRGGRIYAVSHLRVAAAGPGAARGTGADPDAGGDGQGGGT